jgi:hypothetical protein
MRFVDHPVAADRLAVRIDLAHDIIAIGVPAARLAVLDSAAQAAARLVDKVLKVECVHRALKADVQLVDVAFRQGEDPDPDKSSLPSDAGTKR